MLNILLEILMVLVMTALLEVIFFTMPNLFLFSALLIIITFLFLKKLDRIESALSEEKRDRERKIYEKTHIIIPIIVILIAVQTIILYNLHRKGKIDIQSASQGLADKLKK